MARYISDSNQVGFFYESGTYATPTGLALQSAGLVQENSLTSAMNTLPIRFTGNATRDVGQQVNVMEDFEGTLTFYPQDWKGLVFALGSVVSAGSNETTVPYTHTIKALNSTDTNQFTSKPTALKPFISFSIEDSQTNAGSATTNKNFVRTAKGCMVNTWSVSASQGEPVTCEIGYIAQSVTQTSGVATSLTTGTQRPYLFDDLIVSKGGTAMDTVREFSFTINNNLDAPHYINGSKVVSVPIPGNRDYEISMTIDANEDDTIPLYEANLLGGSEFNMTANFTDASAGAGSRGIVMTFSGCKLTSMENPSTMEGVDEQSITIVPKTVTAIGSDTIALYGPFTN